jgi:hypothetical protein
MFDKWKSFQTRGASLTGGSLNAIYQYLLPGASNGYTFGVSAKNQKDNCFYKTVAFGFDNLAMNIGIYSLENRGNGYGGGTYQEFPCGQPFIELMTNDLVKGELDLKKFDTVNQIASGTFWFTILGDSAGVFGAAALW